MSYLHTNFQQSDNDHAQPIIHRDLKSGNLLLAQVGGPAIAFAPLRVDR